MVTIKKTYIGLGIIVAIGAMVLFGLTIRAEATPPTFIVVSSTSAATSTLIYQTPGTATTTVTFDAYKYQGTSEVGGNLAFSTAIQYTASSTATSKLGMTVERSTDGIEWYQDNFERSTTTASYDLSSANTGVWTFASTSQGVANVIATNNRGLKQIRTDIFTRYTRINFYQSGTTNGAVYAEVIGVKNRY